MKSLADIESWLGQPLPEPYRSFLAATAESFPVADGRTLVYGRDAVVERNDTFESRVYCPGHLMVGDDSGGRPSSCRLRTAAPTVWARAR